MIYSIAGIIKEIKDQLIVVEMHGIGLSIFVPSALSFQQGQQVSLVTYLHWHQEQGPSLFGFASETEKNIFELLINCSGVGPKLALAIIGNLGIQGLLEIVQSENTKVFSKVPGIGAKKAEQIIVQLKHKTNSLMKDMPTTSPSANALHEVRQALESLNYSRGEITTAIHFLNKNNENTQLPFDKLLRQALSYLSKRA